MAARIDNGHAQLLTRTGLDWTAKYPSASAAIANVSHWSQTSLAFNSTATRPATASSS